MTDFNKLSNLMKNVFPSNPQEDRAALLELAGKPQQTAAPTKDYLQESVEVAEGSMPVGIDNIADFAALAGVKINEKQRTGSAGQARGSDPTPKTSKPSRTGEQPHPLKDKLVGEEGVDVLALTPGATTLGGALDPDVDDSALIARGLKKASEGIVLSKEERSAIAPYVELFSTLMTNPAFRNNIIAMQKTLKKSKVNNNDDEKTDESGLQYYTGVKKYGKEGMAKLAQAGREGASEEELGRIKDQYKKTESIKERLYKELNKRKI